jgi:hypothetical protein
MLLASMISPEATFFLVLVPILIISPIWQYKRSSAILRHWAYENDLEILERCLGPKTSYLEWRRRRRLRRADPKSFHLHYKSLGCPEDTYLWSHWSQVLFEVTVRDKAGNVQTAWVKCYPWLFGLSNPVMVYWDEPLV